MSENNRNENQNANDPGAMRNWERETLERLVF